MDNSPRNEEVKITKLEDEDFKMRNKLSIFNKRTMHDRACVAIFTTVLILILSIPEASIIFLLFVGYLLMMLILLISYSLPFVRKSYVSVEKVYVGSFDQLLKEMYEAGLQLQTKMGNRYIFGAKYTIHPDDRYLVTDQGEACTVRANYGQMRSLAKYISLKENQKL